MHKKEALRYEIEQDAAFMAVILFDSNKHLCMLIFNSQGNDINISALSQFFFFNLKRLWWRLILYEVARGHLYSFCFHVH